MKMKDLIKFQLENMELFNKIAKETKEALSDFGEVKCFVKGSHIFRDKEKVNKIYICLLYTSPSPRD